MENYDFVFKGANVKIPKKTTDNVIKSNKCNQCDFASSRAGNLRSHMKTHSGEHMKGPYPQNGKLVRFQNCTQPKLLFAHGALQTEH